MGLPPKLEELLALLDSIEDRTERIDLLIGWAERHRPVPASIATRPFDESRRTPGCESEVYVWALDAGGGRLELHFAVENPQGIAAKALAAILGETLAGQPVEAIARVPPDIVYRIFGNELSMGKSMGLMGMVAMVQRSAKLAASRGPSPGEDAPAHRG